MFFSVDRCWAFFAPASANASKRARTAMISATARLFFFCLNGGVAGFRHRMSPLEERAAFFDSDKARSSLLLFCDEVHDRSRRFPGLSERLPV